MKPDSDAREVCGASVTARSGEFEQYACRLERGHDGAHADHEAEWTDATTRDPGAGFCTYHGGTLWPCANCIDGILNPAMYVPPPEKRIALPLHLAQRILAALEREAELSLSPSLRALAAELRAVIGK